MKLYYSVALTLGLLTNLNAASAQTARLEVPEECTQNKFVTSDGVSLHYLIAGKGVPLIFIPGWTMPAEIWENQLSYYSRTNLVIAIDPRSQGKSSQTTEGLHFEREARDVKELIDHLRLSSYYLIGWSWAGPVLYDYLRLFNNPSIKGLIIVDSILKPKPFFDYFNAVNKDLLLDRRGATARFVRGMYKQPQPDQYIDRVVKASLITPTNTAVALLSNFYLHNDTDWIQIIKTSDKPILFIGAGGTEAMYEEIMKEVPINFKVIPGAGHALFVDKPGEFNKILESFVTSTTRQ